MRYDVQLGHFKSTNPGCSLEPRARVARGVNENHCYGIEEGGSEAQSFEGGICYSGYARGRHGG